MSVKVTVRNKDRLFKKLGKLAPAAFEALKKANRQSADEMVELARNFVRVRTGELRDTIVATGPGGVPPSYSQGGGGEVVPDGAYMVSAGNEGVRTAHLVEYGTKPHTQGGRFAGTQHPGTAAQPFFWPAYRLIRKKMRSRATRALNKSIKDVAGQ